MIFHKISRIIWTKRYPLCFLILWALGVAASALLNLHGVYEDTIEKALTEARTISRSDQAFRRWNVLQEGVYTRVSPANQSNPYLIDDQKNLSTNKGDELTQVTHFQMSKQAFNLLDENSSSPPTINRTISLMPLNPENKADAWEQNALLALEKGKKEVFEVTDINGIPYMRLVTPYITEKECLKCHAYQGYKAGDLRGGTSISVPMAPFLETAAASRSYIIITHLILWAIGVVTIVLFFAGLKKYRQVITESANKFRIISEYTHNFEYWIKEQNEIVFISPSCERITGYSRDEFYKNPELLTEIVHSDDIEDYRKHLAEFKSSVHENYQYRIITKSGEVRWLSHTCNPIHVEGKFLGRRGSIQDITGQRRLEEQLIQAQKLESLGHFAGGIAHDFNNILSSISTFSHLLEDELRNIDTDNDLIDYVKYINIASKLGKNLTSNLLAFGRPQSVNLRPMELNSVIENISDLLKSFLTEGIELHISLTKEQIPIFADPHLIEQIIINLCTNAKDAMIEGGTLVIRTELVSHKAKSKRQFVEIPAGNYMTLSVSDTGQGIAQENLERIYEPFFSTKKHDKGTGLGLAIIHNIIKQHNGFIDVESEVGKGTTFSIFFPAHPEKMEKFTQARDTRPDFPAKKNETALAQEGKIARENVQTILLVEDDELVRRSLATILQLKGYNTIVAQDGEEALEQFRTNKDAICLVILDVMLPKKNGREVYRYIKEKNKDVKALFISGFTDNIDLKAETAGDSLDYLQKPLDIDQFVTKVAEMLQG